MTGPAIHYQSRVLTLDQPESFTPLTVSHSTYVAGFLELTLLSSISAMQGRFQIDFQHLNRKYCMVSCAFAHINPNAPYL